MNLEEELKYVEALGKIFVYGRDDKHLTEEQKAFIKVYPRLNYMQSVRCELERIYDSGEYFSCRCRAGMILNYFEEDVEHFLSGAGRADGEKLCLRISQWRKELESKLHSDDYENLPRVFRDETKFYGLLFDLENSALPARLLEEVNLDRDHLSKSVAGLQYLYEEFSGDWEEMIKRLQG